MSLKPRRVDFQAIWLNLKQTVQQIINCDHVTRVVWNDRFSDVYVLCVAHPDPLSDRLYQETRSFLEYHVEQLHWLMSKSGDENVLSMYYHQWRDFSRGADFLNSLYGYLNNQYVKKQKFTDADMIYGGISLDDSEQMLEIGELAFDTWKRRMIEPMKNQLLKLLLEEIHKDRSNGTVNQSVIHGVIDSFVHVENFKKSPLALYESLFETPFLEQTSDFYRNEAVMYLEECSCSDYMEKVLQKLSEENFRSRKFLHPSSYTKVTRSLQQCMVAAHLVFLHGECFDMVRHEKRKDLANMYELLSPVCGGLGTLIQRVEEHIKAVGHEAIKALGEDDLPVRYVESLLDVHTKYKELIATVFHADQQFMGALDKACAAVINGSSTKTAKGHCKSPELLARYCDGLLKKSAKGISDSEIDDKLASSITVFKYLDDKDVYQRYYSHKLARRLIHSVSLSMDLEEAMINRLKQACGYEFTNKLHRMFTDMSISRDLNVKFNQFLGENGTDERQLGINFSMLVLQAGAWPISQNNLPTFAVPQEVERCVTLFERFYQKNFSGRKLTWMHSTCTAELKFNYLKRPYIVTMGTFQMAVLLSYNTALSFTFEELQTATRLPVKELELQLKSLVESKLICSTDDGDTHGTYTLNELYSNKRTKFKISLTQQRESVQESERTHSVIDEDRKLFLHAAIVRIMKSRKQLKHNALVQEVIDQSKSLFLPSISLIKKCIESLIEKQYLERAANTTDVYCYVA